MSRRQPYDLPAPNDGAKVFWKSLEDKASPAAAQERAERELLHPITPPEGKLVKLRRGREEPAAHADESVSIGRRGFMFFAGASAALLAEGCARRPVEKILPYSKAPEHVLPGVSAHYATVRQHRGDAIGLVVESHEGRPTKVDGNPLHPSSRGASDVWTQAMIYSLYDPDRSTTPMRGRAAPAGAAGASTHQPATWAEVDAMLADVLRTAQADSGARLRILVEPSTSPTFIRMRDALLAKLPKAVVHVWSSVNESNAREGAKLAFGQPVTVVPKYGEANVILSLDSDFLGTEPGNIRANLEFAAGRKVHSASDTMSRLYVVEPSFTITGMNADHRLRLAASQVERYLLALARELEQKHAIDIGAIKDAAAKVDAKDIPAKWIQVVAKELAGARAKSVLVAGTRQPARVHALVHALNAALGNAGHTVGYYQVADVVEPEPVASLKQLAQDIEKGAVGTLVILGGNPAYDAPSDLKLADKIRTVGQTVHFSTHFNETSELCQWHAPRAHELESWGDLRAVDGTVAIQQPLIAPLFSGRTDAEVLAKLAGIGDTRAHTLVQETTKGSLSSPGSMTRAWNEALQKGVLGAPGKPMGPMDARKTEIGQALSAAVAPKPLAPDNLEVTFAPCPKIFDGRYANDPLLLELPDPVTKATWDNLALVSAATAKALGLENRQMVRLSRQGAGAVEIAVWITPGQADNSIALVLGWGRQKAGRYGNKHGFDVGPLRTTDAMWIAHGVTVQKLGAGEIEAIKDRYRKVGMAAGESPIAGRVRPDDPFDVETHLYKVSQTQEHDTMEGRPVAIDTTLAEYKKNPLFVQYPDDSRKEKNEKGETIPVRRSGSPDPNVPPLWGEWKNEQFFKGQRRWGMGIDLTACTGCNACVIACQVENNVPAVGKEQVERGREMYWLRIDRYFVGMDADNPEVVFQPVACVQCEEAPCENVCPVNATEHSPEGLNDMAYNRCIGTRYCANNCPYKVRRFNFLNYHTSGGYYDDVPEVEKMRYNPNVTVRMRGVMEKCTYCVQRIQEAKIDLKRTGGKIVEDGDPRTGKGLMTACQQACPTGAIVFGDLANPESKVAKWRAQDRAYRLLAELGTRPRTTYLGKIRNPNSEMEGV
jgi:molybdopterin-containing oxidoreductase family iron-sulfur binding subunit